MQQQSGSEPEAWYEPNEVHVTRIDVPFLDLTWFFVKASVALALAFSVTSWLWVVIATGMVTLLAGLLLVLGVPGWFATAAPPPPRVAPPTPPPVMMVAPQVEVIAPTVEEPEPEPEPEPEAPIDPNQAATEAAQRAELERLRRERGR